MESDYHWIITIGLVISSLVAVTVNFFLLLIFCRRRSLRTVPNRFVINLLITNLLSSILLIPLLLVDPETSASMQSTNRRNETVQRIGGLIIREEIRTDPSTNNIEIIETSDSLSKSAHPFENNTNLMCHFAHSTTSFVCTVSIFSILLIGINQYFGVIHSLRYHFYINRCRSSIFIGISWFVGLLCAILSFLTYSDSSVWHFCNNRAQPSDIMKILNTFYAFSFFIIVILAPFVAICVIYRCIYTAAHENSERMRRSASAPLNPQMEYIQISTPKESSQLRGTLPKVHSAPNFSQIDRDSTLISVIKEGQNNNIVSRTPSERSSSSFISNLKHKISNASVFKYREETRAARISILVIFLVLVCYVPYGITLILSSKCIDVKTSQIFNYLSLVLLVFSNIISPFLFGYRNKRVKREICKIFGLAPSPKQKLHITERPQKPSNIRNSSATIHQIADESFIQNSTNNRIIPEVVVTCKQEYERKSILKRVCSSSNWTSYKKCNFITVPESCISGETRGSFSSASTQISTEE